MGSKYPILPPTEVIKVLEKIGFQKTSQKGSHAKYKKMGNPQRVVIIPMHNEIAKGTLKSILEQANLQLEEFLNLLK
jgi:predicted RNA binding protein YcfA (HicA-like mRNA interferase family)